VPCLDETLKTVLKYGLVCFVTFMVASYFLAEILGLVIFFFTPEGLEVSSKNLQLFLYVTGVTWLTPIWVNVALFFVVCSFLYLLCFLAAWSFPKAFHKLVTKPTGQPLRVFFKNYLFSFPALTSLLFVMVLAVEAVAEMFRFPSGPPPSYEAVKGLEQLVHLAYSPIIEEVGFRLIPIGTYLFLFTLAVGRTTVNSRAQLLKNAVTAFFFPDKAKQAVHANNVCEHGFWKGISVGEWGFVAFTSVWFGYTHLLYGWQPGKLVTASMCGVALGLTYLVYGIHAPILLHWWFNYYLNVYSYAHLLAEGFPWTLVQNVILSATVFAGALGWIWITYYEVMQRREVKG